MSCLLVVACCGHGRRNVDPAYEADRGLYLKQWRHSLRTLQYDSDVVFVSNGGPPAYEAALEVLESEFEVIRRDNRGMSHGCFQEAWLTHPDYDYYLMIEDDYLFVRDHFDALMIEEIESRVPDCGMLCTHMAIHDGCVPFPSHQNGIVRGACLEATNGVTGNDSTYGGADWSQINWGIEIAHSRFYLSDTRKRFRAPFWDKGGNITCLNPDAPEELLVPSQMYEP